MLQFLPVARSFSPSFLLRLIGGNIKIAPLNAVSIHKAQGLEYDSVKVIIPQSNSEKITHGIFYTAITRAKKKLKIYWSAETMKEIVSGFATNESNGKSLEIVKAKLAVTQ